MKNFIVCASIAIAAFFATAGTAEAGCGGCAESSCGSSDDCCIKPAPALFTLFKKKACCKETTVEVCRNHFCKTKKTCGGVKTMRFVEVTYRTTDCCGRVTVTKKVYRA